MPVSSFPAHPVPFPAPAPADLAPLDGERVTAWRHAEPTDLTQASDAALAAECTRRGWRVERAASGGAPTLDERILAYLRAQGETSTAILRRVLDVSPPEVGHAVRGLEGDGRVVREGDMVRLAPASGGEG